MPQLNVTIMRFRRVPVTIGDVRLTLLKLEGREERQVYGDPLEVVARIMEEELKSNVDYVLLEVSGHGFRSYFGEGSRSGGIQLFPKPSRLRRIGLVRSSKLELGAGYYRFRESDIEWFGVGEEYYVYDSIVEAPEDVIFLVVDTVDGRSITMIQHSLKPSQSYQLPSQQDQPGESSEGELGVGSNHVS